MTPGLHDLDSKNGIGGSVPARKDALDSELSLSQMTAGAALVNRTRRVVNERARSMQVRKSRMRSLYIPLLVSAGLLAAVVFALWSLLEGYDATSTGLPDSSQQIMVLLMWCLPVSAAMLAAVWMRRAGPRFDRRAGDGRPQ